MAIDEEFDAQVERNSFPKTPLFERVVEFANHHRLSQKVVFNDHKHDIKANHADLLVDILRLRVELLQYLSPTSRSALKSGCDVYIALIANTSYEWLVGCLGIISLGAAVVLIAPSVLDQELDHFVEITNAAAILYHPTATNGTKLPKLSKCCPLVEFPIYNGKRPGNYTVSFTLSNRTFNPLRIGWLLFTSGTTSVPKAVLHYRKAFVPVLLDHIDRFKLTGEDVGIMQVAGHWMRGVSGQLMFLLAGSHIEYIHDNWTAKWMWERMSISPVTCFIGKARDFYALAAYHEEHLRHLPAKQLVPYTAGLRNLRLPISAGVPLTSTIRDAWNWMEGHNPLINEYGSTETFNLMAVCPEDSSVSPTCVGKPWVGVEAKLSEGDSGEVRVRSSSMFAGYLNEPGVTASTFDSDGFFCTGDSGYREGSNYFLVGRTSVDVIRWAGFKVYAVEVEESIAALPYIDKAMVVPVPDTLCHHRVGVITWPGTAKEDISLPRLRNDLYHAGVSQYKLPTVLHRAPAGDIFPCTQTGKPAKKAALETYFPNQYQSTFPVGRVQVYTKPGSDQQISGQTSAHCAPLANRAWDQGGVYH